MSQVAALWRYPVKSMQGETLTEAEIGPTGIVGDRGWVVVDSETGLGLTGRREPQLLYAHAALVDDGVSITLPDGSVPDDDEALSTWLGRAVTLVRADAQTVGTFEIGLAAGHCGLDRGDHLRGMGAHLVDQRARGEDEHAGVP